MTYPDGKKAVYTYDAMNRLISVKGADGKKTTYTYDLNGQRISTNGAREDTAYTYDEVGNLISQVTTGKYDVSLNYTYDLSGRMISESRTENGAAVESSYIYDAIGQLTEFTRSDGIAESYTYDPAGNMLSKTAGGIKTNYTYNAGNQLVGDGTYRYTYDKIGNLVEKAGNGGQVSYTYNALNLLEKWTDGENTETYTYNAAGLLSTVNTNTSTTSLTWDILYGDGVVISANENGAITDYTYGLERISASTKNSRTEYVYDGRGSVIGEVTKAGLLSIAKVTTKAYTPFGEQIGEKTSGFGWNGEYHNATTGMVYLRARFYEPEMNRFSQKDIVRGSVIDGASLNRYTYCVNDPISFIDPSGATLKSALTKAVNKVVNTVTTAVKNFVSDPVGTAAKAANTAINAVSHPVSTAVNAAKSVANAVTSFVNEVKAPASTAAPNVSAKSQSAVQATAGAVMGVASGIASQITGSQNNKTINSDNPSVASGQPYACTKYEREDAVDYAVTYAYSHNPDYVPFDNLLFSIRYLLSYGVWTGNADCANFVSQSLVAGNIQQNEDWHFNTVVHDVAPWQYQLFSDKMWFQDANGNLTTNAISYDFTGSWSVASAQFDYFGNPENGYTSIKPVPISSPDLIEETLEKYNVQIGDLLYWVNDNGEVHHATIISSVEGGEIKFAGHTRSADYKKLSDTMISNGESVYIILMNDYVEEKK